MPNRDANMLELWQAEWCPHCHRVRQRLTELGLDYITHQVPAERQDRTELHRLTEQRSIPVMRDRTIFYIGSDTILGHLNQTYPDTPDTAAHHRRAESASHSTDMSSTPKARQYADDDVTTPR